MSEAEATDITTEDLAPSEESQEAPVGEASTQPVEAKAEPDAAQKAINRKHWEAKEAERQRDKTLEENAQLKAQLAEFNKQPAPEVAPTPDPYADDYAQQQELYAESIRQQTRHAAQQEADQRAAQDRMQQQQNLQRQEQERYTKEYNDNVIAQGLEVDQVQKAIIKLAEGGKIPQEIGAKLVEDEQSPLIIAWLAEGDNYLEAAPMLNMTPHQQSIFIGTTLRDKASVLKPKTSETPEPQETLDGGGASEIESELLRGATFE